MATIKKIQGRMSFISFALALLLSNIVIHGAAPSASFEQAQLLLKTIISVAETGNIKDSRQLFSEFSPTLDELFEPCSQQEKTTLQALIKQLEALERKAAAAAAPALPKQDYVVDRIVELHRRPVPWDGKLKRTTFKPKTLQQVATYIDVNPSKYFAEGRALVTQLGALGQDRSLEDNNKYCGYYAVHNILCLLKIGHGQSLQPALLNRQFFASRFTCMLPLIKAKKSADSPYDYLYEDDIEELLKSEDFDGRHYIFIAQKKAREKCIIPEIIQMRTPRGQIPPMYKTLADFQLKRSDVLNIIFNVGGHWITVQARHEKSAIHFYLIDSKNIIDWTDGSTIEAYLLPLFNFLI